MEEIKESTTLMIFIRTSTYRVFLFSELLLHVSDLLIQVFDGILIRLDDSSLLSVEVFGNILTQSVMVT